jgi:serine/threonine-protein kinase
MTSAIPGPLVSALADRYRIERELGRGGMATVYLADDLKHRRKVAIKVLREDLAAAIGRERFLREIEIAARLTHPHILPLHDSGAAGEHLYYITPYIAGGSLRARLEREKQLPLEDALRIAREIASALGHAHREGLVHRDIKPENVLLSEGIVLVADFGIARVVSVTGADRLTTANTAIGTPRYMAPEQVMGSGDVDGRADLYALGCVLYEMLAGQPPFTGPDEGLAHQHLSVAARAVAELRPTVPNAVSAAISKVLAKAKADRFASATAFAEAVSERAAEAPAPRSVAVLPFLNLSSNPENEYFADGITEDVIAQLSKVRTLKVISRTSVMPFKKREQSLREIGARLEVATVLEGSVRRVGDRVRIVAQLIDAASDQHLWADTYDRELTDIFAIQTDVALQIAAALKAELSPKERARIHREPTSDVQAYELYLRGRYCFVKFTWEEMHRSIEYFESAIERDPEFALAYVGMAMAYTELGETGAMIHEQAKAKAMTAAAKAVALDPELGAAHCALAYARLVFEFDWAGAEKGFKRALELSPGDADTYDLYGRFCAGLERFDEAIALQGRARELDPITHRADVATAFLRAARHEEATQAATRAVKLDPHDPRTHATLGWALFKQGHTSEGIAQLERAVSLSPGETLWLGQLGQAYALAGMTEKAREILRQLEDPARPTPASSYHLAYVYTGLGEADRAMDCLERAFEERIGALYGLKGSFLFAPLRHHPRFIALLKKMNL